MTEREYELLHALDDTEWRRIGYRLGTFRPSDAFWLVRDALVEERERERKRGAHEYRRTSAGHAALQERRLAAE